MGHLISAALADGVAGLGIAAGRFGPQSAAAEQLWRSVDQQVRDAYRRHSPGYSEDRLREEFFADNVAWFWSGEPRDMPHRAVFLAEGLGTYLPPEVTVEMEQLVTTYMEGLTRDLTALIPRASVEATSTRSAEPTDITVRNATRHVPPLRTSVRSSAAPPLTAAVMVGAARRSTSAKPPGGAESPLCR